MKIQGNSLWREWEKLKKDFIAFTKSQIKHFGSFPVNQYHFLFQITPYKSYHGVEHTKNTVLLLGPGEDIMDTRYDMGSYTFQIDAAKTKTENISVALISRMMLDIDDEFDLAFMLKQNVKQDFCKKIESCF